MQPLGRHRVLSTKPNQTKPSYLNSMEKAVRGTRWHFKWRLCPEREFVAGFSTVPRGRGPTSSGLCRGAGSRAGRVGSLWAGGEAAGGGGLLLPPLGLLSSESSHAGESRPISAFPGPDASGPHGVPTPPVWLRWGMDPQADRPERAPILCSRDSEMEMQGTQSPSIL